MIKNLKNSFFFLLLILISCKSKEQKSINKKNIQEITVDTYIANPIDFPLEIEVSGSILPMEKVDIYSEISGRVQDILFIEGKKVEKGAVLVQMDTDILLAQKKKLLVDLDLAKKDLKRKTFLYEANGISEEEYEKAQSNVFSLEASLELLNVQISKAKIRAPFSGTIGLRQISEGAFLNQSSLISTLIQDDYVKIEFSIPEIYASSVKLKQIIKFKTNSDTNTYYGEVFAFQPYVKQDSRMLTIHAKVKNNGKLISGSFVSITYSLGVKKDTYLIPSGCIIPILKGQKIFIIKNGIAKELPIEIGIRTANKVQVFGEIQKGDTVITSGILAIKNGMKVNTK